MAGRRHFIRSGLALAASLPTIGAWAAPSSSSAACAAHRFRPERFIFDARFADAVAVAREAAALGAQTIRIEGDLTKLWYEDLDLAWKRRPMTIAGITTRQGLFVLETLAADRRMRVVYRGRHDPAGANRAVHTLTGPSSMLEYALEVSSPALASSDETAAPLMTALAREMMRCPASRDTATIDIETVEARSVRAEALCSWVIAPRAADAKPV